MDGVEMPVELERLARFARLETHGDSRRCRMATRRPFDAETFAGQNRVQSIED